MTITCLCEALCEKSRMFWFRVLMYFVPYCLFTLASVTVLCVDEYVINNFIFGYNIHWFCLVVLSRQTVRLSVGCWECKFFPEVPSFIG